MGCSLYTGIGIIKLLIFTAFNSKTFTIIINMSTVCAKLVGKGRSRGGGGMDD